MYSNSRFFVGHSLDVVAEFEGNGAGQSASDDDVPGLDVLTQSGQLADQPDHARRRMN